MQNAAFRCGLAAVFIAFIASAHAENRHVDKPPVTDGAVCQQPLSNFPAAWSLCPAQPSPIEKDETYWAKPNCPNPNSHDEADLCVQRDMAAYAWETLVLGRWQFLFTVLGFAALIYTLHLTRDANEIARDTAKRELRAYVFAERAVLSKGQDFFKAVVTIRNSGQTPAYKFDHFAIIEGTSNPRTVPFIGGDIDVDRQSCIAPGSHVGVICESNIMPAGRIEDIENGRAIIWVWGEIYYDDAFGIRRFTKYRFFYNGADAKTDSSGVMMSDREGNEAT